jgi:hypothetical protein
MYIHELHHSRRNGSRWQVGMRSSLCHGVVTGGWPINGNLADDDRWCRSRGRGQVWVVMGKVAGWVRNGLPPVKE